MQTQQEVFDAVKTTAIAATGTGTSVALQNVNQLMAALAGFATFIYVCLKIYDWFKNRRSSYGDEK